MKKLIQEVIQVYQQLLNNMKKIIISIILILIPTISHATDWYVRTDGGTSTECTGQADAPYDGDGSGEACAFEHWNWAIVPQGQSQKISGGDTVYVAAGEYMVGYGSPNQHWQQCETPATYDCYNSAIPSGTAENPTKILGEGWDTGCNANNKEWARPTTQLWGTGGVSKVVTVGHYVQMNCIELTDHSSCNDVFPNPCSDSYPYGDIATTGLEGFAKTGVVLTNMSIHGFRERGIYGVGNGDWTLNNVQIVANGKVGWDGDKPGGSGNKNRDISDKWEVMYNDDRNEVARIRVRNINNSDNATSAVTMFNDIGASPIPQDPGLDNYRVSLGIASSAWNQSGGYGANSSIAQISPAPFSYINFYDDFFAWRSNPSDNGLLASTVELMRLTSDKKLGIGNDNPQYNIQVEGTIQGDDYYSGDESKGLDAVQRVLVRIEQDGEDYIEVFYVDKTYKDGLLTNISSEDSYHILLDD